MITDNLKRIILGASYKEAPRMNNKGVSLMALIITIIVVVIFVKKWGIEVFEKATFDGKHIRFLWPMSVIPDAPGPVDEKELALFAAKIKEWRRQNECTDKGRRHFSKKQS